MRIMTMSQEDSRSLDEQLERLAATLSASNWSQVRMSVLTRQLLEQIVDFPAIDCEILQEFGYFTIEQAYTRICDGWDGHDNSKVIVAFKTEHGPRPVILEPAATA
jgi:hypothetical protein